MLCSESDWRCLLVGFCGRAQKHWSFSQAREKQEFYSTRPFKGLEQNGKGVIQVLPLCHFEVQLFTKLRHEVVSGTSYSSHFPANSTEATDPEFNNEQIRAPLRQRGFLQ